MRLPMLFAFAAVLAAGAAEARPPLKENPIVRREVFGAAVGYEIYLHCPHIGGRWLRAFARARELERYVKSLGYTRKDIDALIHSKSNLDELVRLRDAYLAKKGVREGDTASYCRLGQEEIANNTFTGWLLRLHSRPVAKDIPEYTR